MKFGISILSIVPMRSEISDKSEMVSQILFGGYKIIEQKRNFLKYVCMINMKVGYVINR